MIETHISGIFSPPSTGHGQSGGIVDISFLIFGPRQYGKRNTPRLLSSFLFH